MPDFHLKTVPVRLKMNQDEFVEELNKTIFWVPPNKDWLDRFLNEASFWSYAMLGVGAVFLISCYIMVSTLSSTANNQAHRIRIKFFKAILKQDISWFDTKPLGDFASKITADLEKIQEGIGDKVVLCIFAYSTAFCSLGAAFYYGWELTLIILSTAPLMIVSNTIISKIQAKYSTTEAESYSKAGAVAEEVLGAIRTVYAFDGQTKEIKRYDQNLKPAKKGGIKRTMFSAIGLGFMWLCVYSSYALSFWYGVRLIIRSIDNNSHQYEASTLLIIFFSVMQGTFSVSSTTPYVEAFALARGAAAIIFEVIERKPDIDSSSDSGETLQDFNGRVELSEVHFAYPSRPDVPVLKGINLVAEPGQTVALVGPSGCGKSTVIQLIQRFYDTGEGQVLIDGRDVRELNVGWLRDNIGVVGQEPVLFGCSIADNIRLGYGGADETDIERVAKDANAYDFIMRLPEKFDTLVGERGSQMSGGQKQRIAIARALVRKPKILLLDESTSALDMQSESIVQAALDRASVGRTTFIVAHRLSTIRSADKIIVINSGKMEEVGTHEELVKREGLYYKLVKTQQVNEQEHSNSEVIDDEPIEHPITTRALSIDSHKSVNEVEREDSLVVKNKEQSASLWRILGLLKPDKWILVVGVVMSLLVGLSIPAFAIIFGDIIGVLAKPSTDEIQKNVLFYSFIFIGMGVTMALASFLQMFLFGVCAERLTMRLRKLVFTAMLRQEIAWYDQQDNSSGALCSRLSSDASRVHGAAGSRLSTLFQALSTLSVGISIAMYYNWKLGLVMVSFTPAVMVSVYFQMTILKGQFAKDVKSQEEAARIAVEAISSIRTVASLHQESTFLRNYIRVLQTQFNKSKIRAHLQGFTFGLAQCMSHVCYAVALFYGSRLMISDDLNYGDVFKSIDGVISGTAFVGQSVAFAPGYLKGKLAAINIFKLLDRRPLIDINNTTGEKPESCEGSLSFRAVEFTYPTRPNEKVLRGLSFDVPKGLTVALVGASGCGKSTIIQLIQRFYDCDAGDVVIDNRNIVNLNIPWLRHKLGIVSQEPVLFGYSIAENIAYGDNSRSVGLSEIVRASEKANIHHFIQSLPMGYDTPVGDKGTQLSGGQKQRIAIARALIRDPDILLLDEATSALDSESEQVVQQALDEARQGRTCIVIAHRLSTIQNADKIVVVNRGQVVEEGSHNELIARRGQYFKLNNIQNSVQ